MKFKGLRLTLAAPNKSKMQTRALNIGGWIANPDAGTLTRRGQERTLQPRQMDVLFYLASHPGQVVSVGELLDHVWAGLVVEEQAVYGVIAELRKALGDTGKQHEFIRTVPKRGYVLMAEVRPLHARRKAPLYAAVALLMVVAFAAELSISLQPEVKMRPGPATADVYDQYLLARRFWNQRNMEEAIRAFEHVTALDPGFAPAWAGLASAHAYRLRYTSKSAAMTTIVTPLADRALELQPDLPEALAAMAAVAQQTARPLEAIALFERAVAGDPGNLTWKIWLSQILRDYGYIEQALELSQEAFGIDPLSMSASNNVAWNLYRAGDLDAALEFASIHDELAVGAWGPTTKLIGLIYAVQQDWPALEDLLERHELVGDDLFREAMGIRLALERGALDGIGPYDEALSPNREILFPMEAWCLVGECDRALEGGLRLLEQNQWVVPSTLWTPLLQPARSDPRFVEIVLRHPIAMPEVWAELGWPDYCGPADGSGFTCW